jgi:hypothetical protein
LARKYRLTSFDDLIGPGRHGAHDLERVRDQPHPQA